MANREGPTTPTTTALLTWGFVKLSLGFLFCCLNLSLFALVPYYLELRGVDELLFGLAAGMHGLGGVVAMVVLGGQADRRSRRSTSLRYAAASLVGTLLALFAMGWHPAWYLVALGLQGVTGGVGLPVLFVWASELCPPSHRTEAFAWLGIAGLVADSLGPLLAEALLLAQPGPVAASHFFAVFVVANLLAPLTLLFLRWAPDVTPPAPMQSGDAGFASLLKQPHVRAVLLAAATFGGALGVMLTLGKNFVASIGLQFVSVLLGGHTVGAIAARLLLPWILRRFDRVRMIPVAFLGVALAMGLLAATRGYGLLTVAGLLYGVSHGLLFPTLLSRVIDFAGSQAAGRTTTLYMGMFGLGYGAIPAAGGVVLRFSGPPALFVCAGISCLGGLALTLWAERAYRARRAPGPA